jgi:uncharacterized membrane protein
MRQRSLGLHRPTAVAAVAMALVSILAVPVLAQSPSPSATPEAAPPSELTVSTTYPSIEVDPGGEASFPLSVTSPTSERVALEVTTVPEGFTATVRGGGSIVAAVTTTGTAESPELELSVQVPEGTPPGTSQVVLTATGESGAAELSVDLVVADVSEGTVSLTTDTPGLRGDTESPFTFNLTLTNDTSAEQAFTLEGAGPEGWTIEVTPSGETQAVSAIVPAGDDERITATITPPRFADATQYPFVVRAVAQETGLSAETPLIVEITGSYAMELTTPDERLNAQVTAGGTTALPLLLVNTGTAPLTEVTLAATPPRDWNVTFDQETVPVIEVGQSVTVNAQIAPVGNAVAGDYQLTIRASNDQINESVQIRTTVETSSIWWIVGIALIAIVLIGLFLVFRRYGRR